MDADNLLSFLNRTIYSDNPVFKRPSSPKTDPDERARQYFEATLAVNVPSFPLANPFVQAENYTGLIYLCTQHMIRRLSKMTVGLEKKKDGLEGKPSPGAQKNSADYVPIAEHPFLDVLSAPNPVDTCVMFIAQCLVNWNLHGVIRIWGVPNKVGAPERMYCLPVPLTVPAFNMGSNEDYPLGAWRVNQYYPATGLTGILPTGLAGVAGAPIDARDVYEIKNPHPIYKWAPYSHLQGGAIQVDLHQQIDRSFHSVMNQSISPKGIIDVPGLGDTGVKLIQSRLMEEHGGSDNWGKIIVLGGGDLERPTLAYTPLVSQENTPHAEGWERYASFICALFGLDLSALGLRQGGGYAERWAAKEDARDNAYLPFLMMLAELLTRTGGRRWGLEKHGGRVIYDLPKEVGYAPDEMSRDGANDDTLSVNEIRALRGYPPVPDGDVCPSVYRALMAKKYGTDETSDQKDLQSHAASLGGKDLQQDDTPPQNPAEQSRPDTPKEAKGALGGSDSGAPRVEAKGTIEDDPLHAIINRVMNYTPSLNGTH